MFVAVVDGDVPAIVTLMNRAYRGSGSLAGWSTEAGYIAGDRTTAALLRADLLATPQALLLKWIEPPDDDVLGCVWLEPLGGGTWYIGSLATDPDRQNAGLGRTLLVAAEDHARALGARRMQMSVINIRDALIGWYQRRGYELTGATEPFRYGDDRFGTPLRDDLEFVVLAKELASA